MEGNFKRWTPEQQFKELEAGSKQQQTLSKFAYSSIIIHILFGIRYMIYLNFCDIYCVEK